MLSGSFGKFPEVSDIQKRIKNHSYEHDLQGNVVKAVNQDGRFGMWVWDVAFIPSEVRPKIAKYVKADVSNESMLNVQHRKLFTCRYH